ARGLDLPDVELVLHADLPENAESLTHRSGRTGRAGRKGTSVVIADLRERRKAERLLASARTTARWTPAPTAHDVRRSLIDGLRSELIESVSSVRNDAEETPPDGDQAANDDGAAASATGETETRPAKRTKRSEAAGSGDPAGAGLLPEEAEELADRLRAALPERVLIASLLGRELARMPAPLPLSPLDPNQRPTAPRLTANPRAGRERGEREDANARAGSVYGSRGNYGPAWDEAVLFRVNLGAAANAEPGWLLPLICRRGGVTRREVGAIRVGATTSTFEIAANAAADFALSAGERDPRAPHVVIEPAGEGAGHVTEAPPARGPRPMKASPRRPREDGPPRAPRAAAWSKANDDERPARARGEDEGRPAARGDADPPPPEVTATPPAEPVARTARADASSAPLEPPAVETPTAKLGRQEVGRQAFARDADATDIAAPAARPAKAKRERDSARTSPPAGGSPPPFANPAPPLVDEAAAFTTRARKTTNPGGASSADFGGFVPSDRKPLQVDRAPRRPPAPRPPRPATAGHAPMRETKDAERPRKSGPRPPYGERPGFGGFDRGPRRPAPSGPDPRGRFGGVRRDAGPAPRGEGPARRNDGHGPPRRNDGPGARPFPPRGFDRPGPARGPRFSPSPGAPARPSGRKDDRPPRGRPRSGT
ncbi:MAG TPA: DbpA RNA binding domain-containing protein, partial [Polyangia bacterium]